MQGELYWRPISEFDDRDMALFWEPTGEELGSYFVGWATLGGDIGWNGSPVKRNPTHWCPLPDPPKPVKGSIPAETWVKQSNVG